MMIILSLLLLGVTTSTTTLYWSKDAGEAPTFHKEKDGSLTAIYKIMEGRYSDIEPYRRRLEQLTSTQLRTKLLDKHNELRAKTANGLAPCKCGILCGTGSPGIINGQKYHPGATNMNALFWDAALEKVAKQYSDKCLFIHNNGRSTEAYQYRYLSSWNQNKEKYMGENLYISSTGEVLWNKYYGSKDYGIEGGLQGWWDECIDFQLSEGGSCGDSVGHYTQYVRADARFVGCGVTICPNGVQTKSSSYSWANMNIVCNYAGGQYGDMPYQIAETAEQVASNCDPDRTPNMGLQGLCGGPMAKDYFENPQNSYDKTSFSTDIWICDDGTGNAAAGVPGRNVCNGETTKQPAPYPTKKPTNNPITPQPTGNPITPTLKPTSEPTKSVTNKPTKNIVTPRPTSPTPSPITPLPTRTITKKPTTPEPTTPQPSVSPLSEPNGCDLSDCRFSLNIQWKSEKWKYRGLANAVWNTEKEILGLEREESWGGKYTYSWGGQYRRSETTRQWILYIWDNVDVDWDQMECTKREYITTFMQSLEFEEKMKSGIEILMGEGAGEVTDVTVTITCDSTSAAAFGEITEDLDFEIPFSTWNLNTYTFSDWFVLCFVLFTGCFICFGFGYLMHRRRVFKAIEEVSFGDYQQEQPLAMVSNNRNISHAGNKTVNLNYGDTSPLDENIQIGVSVNSNQHGIIGTNDSDDDNL